MERRQPNGIPKKPPGGPSQPNHLGPPALIQILPTLAFTTAQDRFKLDTAPGKYQN